MSKYEPEKWVILKISYKDRTDYKILSSWSGRGFTGDCWRLSSGIVDVSSQDISWIVENHSGSIYTLSKKLEGMSSIIEYVYNSMLEQVDLTESFKAVEVVSVQEVKV